MKIPMDSTGLFQCDPETHTYYLGEKVLPSVTQILDDVGIIDSNKFCKDEFYLDRGHAIHSATDLIDKGQLDRRSLDKRIKGYVAAYEAFKKDTGFEVMASEIAAYSKTYKYAGTSDKIGLLYGNKSMIDLKSNDVPGWCGIQLSGYCELFPGKMYERFGLGLKEDGSYRLRQFDNFRDRTVFLAALNVYNYKHGRM